MTKSAVDNGHETAEKSETSKDENDNDDSSYDIFTGTAANNPQAP